MATLTSTRVSADAPGEMTPRERYIMRAVLRAIEEWEQLENAESIVTQGRKVPDNPDIDRLRAAIFRDIG
jgi:hypothetical protein